MRNRRSTILLLSFLIAALAATPALSAPLLHHWPGDGDASDAVGGVDGIEKGNTTFADGEVGEAFSFDGDGDYVLIDKSASIIGTGPFSVTAWIKTSSSADQVIVQQRTNQRTNGSDTGWIGEWILSVSWYHENRMNKSDPGKLCYWDHTLVSGQGLGLAFCSKDRVDDGRWHHVTFTRDAAGKGSLYIDGVLNGSQNRAISPTPLLPLGIGIGGDYRDGQRWFEGEIDEVKFFGAALSQSVDIDIKPGSDSNPINLKSKGLIPVAILTTDDFDATTVDAATVRFGPGEAEETHGKGHIDDVDGDGDDDLVLHFRVQEVGVQTGDTELTLTGKTQDGQDIVGSDAIRIVGKAKKLAAPSEAPTSWGIIKKEVK